MVTRGEWSGGWRTLLAGVIAMTTSWNVVSIVLSVFLLPMQREFGWSRTALSISPIVTLLSACLLPITGLLLDRFGARRVAIAGTSLMAFALGLFGLAGASYPGFIGLVLLLSVAAATTNSVVLARGLASWFSDQLGTALGILFLGVSVSLVVLVPAIGGIVEHDGWRRGFLALSGVATIVSLPLLLLLFKEPQLASAGAGVARPDSFAVLMRRSAFWVLILACACASVPIGGAVGHLVPILASHGLSLAAASGYASIFAIAIGVSGLVTGILFDRTRASRVMAVTLALSAIGSILLLAPAGTNDGVLAIAAGLTGLATGSLGNCINYFPARLFGLQNFARLVSLLALTISLAMAVGGLSFAFAFDRLGSYDPMLIASAVLYLAAAALLLLLPAGPAVQ